MILALNNVIFKLLLNKSFQNKMFKAAYKPFTPDYDD